MSSQGGTRIADLPAYTDEDPVDGSDVIAVVDKSGNTTRMASVNQVRGPAPTGGSGGDLGDLDNVASTADAADSNNNLKVLINDPATVATGRWRDIIFEGRIENGILQVDGGSIRDGTITRSKLADGVIQTGSVAGLTDVDLTDIEDDQFLRRSGAAWVNSKLAVGDIPQLPASKITGLPTGGSDIDLGAIDENILPARPNIIDIGSATNPFRTLYSLNIGGNGARTTIFTSRIDVDKISPHAVNALKGTNGVICRLSNDVIISSEGRQINLSKLVGTDLTGDQRTPLLPRNKLANPVFNTASLSGTTNIDFDADYNIFEYTGTLFTMALGNTATGGKSTVVIIWAASSNVPSTGFNTFPRWDSLIENGSVEHAFNANNPDQLARFFTIRHQTNKQSDGAVKFELVNDRNNHAFLTQ